MNVLGIESSCDETGVALVGFETQDPPQLLAQALHSQIDMHRDYGGVVPELASRDHIRRVLPLTRQVLEAAGLPLGAIDVVAYTRGPALARLADFGDPLAYALPRPLLHSGNLDFSFAGLKTAVRTQVAKLGSNVCEQ